MEIAGQRVEPFDLPDDPADSRGVLSSLAGTHQGTFGFLMRRSVDLGSSPSAAAAIHKGQVSVRLHVPEGPLAKGLSVYGERMGQYPVDPTLIVYTQRDLKHPAGWTSVQPVAIVD